jgi:hypothetical protein
MSCAAFLVFDAVWEAEISPAVRLAAFALAGLSPLAVRMSATVMAEVPFLLVSAIVFRLVSRNWERPGAAFWLGVGSLAGYGALLRPNGFALAVALAAALAWERRGKEAAVCAAAGVAPPLLFVLRNRLLTGVGTSYAAQLAAPLLGPGGSAGAAARVARLNALYYLREAFSGALFAWPLVPGRFALELAAGALGTAAVLTGVRAFGGSGWRKCLWLYAAAYLGTLLVFPQQTARYLYPLLPLIAAAAVMGAERWSAGLGYARRPALAALTLLGLLGAADGDGPILAASLRGGGVRNEPPVRTYDWIRRRTGPGEAFAAPFTARLFLLTGRRGLPFPRAESDAALAAWAAANGVSRFLIEPADAKLRAIGGSGPSGLPEERATAWTLSESPRFVESLEDRAERTAIFEPAAGAPRNAGGGRGGLETAPPKFLR